MRITDRLRIWGKATQTLFTGNVEGMMAGIFPGAVGTPPKRGTRELLDAYNTMPWLHAVVNKVSRSVASTTWQLYRAGNARAIQRAGPDVRKGMLKQAELVEVETHPVLDLLDNANEFLTGLTARQLTQIYLDLTGEAFWLLERNGAGRPVEYWPIPPDWVLDTPTPDKEAFRVSFRGWQGEIPKSEIIWMFEPDPVNPYSRGSGTGRALADELETDEYASKHVKSWFYNRARPDIIISADGLTPQDTARLEEDWLRKSQGFWKAYKPYFMSRKVDIQALSQSFESMQLVDLRKYERDTIVQVYGVPPEILGIIESSNRATIASAELLYSKWVIQPRLEFLRAVLQEKLVPEFDDRLIIDYVSPVSEDKEYNLQVAQAAPWSLTVDEWREMQGLEPLADGAGKVYMMPYNLYPSRGLGSVQAVETESAERKTVKTLTTDEIQKLIDAVKAEILVEAMIPGLKDTIAHFGQRIASTVGIDFNILDPRVTEFLEKESSNRIRGINDTTRNALREQLAEGVREGENVTQIADRVSQVFETAKGPRAEAIARTETGRAANYGAWESMIQVGVEEKEWLATRDDRVRGLEPGDDYDHISADGQIVKVDQPFAVSGEQMMYPRDDSLGASAGNIVNCRCTLAMAIEHKTMYDSEDKRVKAWKQFDTDLVPREREMLSRVKKAFQQQQYDVMGELKRLGR